MIKSEMRASVQSALRAIDKTAKFHDSVVDQAIEHSMNQFLFDIYIQRPMDLDAYTREYGSEVALEVKENESTRNHYTKIPAAYIPLPEKNSGIRYVVSHDRDRSILYPMSMREMLLAPQTYSGSVTSEDGDPYTRSFYAVRGDTIIYHNINNSLINEGVRMGIVIPFREYADTDEVNVPFGQNDKVFLSTVQKIAQIPPVDLRDNNKD